MKNISLYLTFMVLFSIVSYGQSPEEVREIVQNYDLKLLKEKEEYYRKQEEIEKKKAIAAANINHWPLIIVKDDGSIAELMKLTPDGYPIYYSTENVNAARSTRTNHLHSGGSLGLNLEGQGMTVRVWDGGRVRASHNAFGGRVTVVDDLTEALNFHSTHVTGTMVASANPASVKGMAPQATARTFNWTNDESEALSEIQLGMLVSNHSYGVPISGGTGPLPSWIIGAYIPDSYAWDDIAYSSPYYLQVASAGNDGDNNANTDPIAFGFDKLVGNKVSKNNLVVANAQDVSTNTDGTISGNININSSSSQGPTDDLRIKPDITGNGTGLTSTNSTSNTSTTVLTGTSMSSPNVAGSLILLQQHHNNLYGSFMRSATLKGIACHTADDAGDIGPDAVFGWGLLNTKKSAETISNNGLTSWISEENLNQGQTFTMNVNSNGTQPLIASITWTDVPGAINTSGIPNDPTKVLVNDLDIRITRNGTTYYPWRLTSDPNNAAIRNGDNNVDNIEQVKIDNPTAGQYTITVTHKTNLVNNSQKYSLVITGINSTFALNSTSSDVTVCSNQNAQFTFSHNQTGAGTTTFSAAGLPSGASATFSPTSLSSNGTVTMTITGLSNVTPNEYFVGITGNNGTETETRLKSLRIFNSTFQNVVITSPTNGQSGLSTSAILNWQEQANAQSYLVQLSTSPSFSTLLVNQTVTTNEYFATGLDQETVYYWRVTPSNQCGSGNSSNSTVNSFSTGILVCDQSFVAEDYSNATIADVPNSSASVPLTITGGYTIGDININLNITHTWVQDMTISLIGPPSIGSPEIILFQEACGDNQDIDCTLDDDGGAPQCSGIPSISGSIAPFESLSSLNTLPADGVWTLYVDDPWDNDGGSINLFSIDLCRVTPSTLSVASSTLNNVSVYPNPTKGTVNVMIPNTTEKSIITLFDLQGREILKKETNQINTSFSIDSLQDGIYMVNIENSNGTISKKIVLRR
ncbi:S8 family serine peptidase [Flavobacterium sp.]|uniref:S8 family serine peptidase n=1 Tax=Flavobacterium sp. TaxID=239 RepID=UPI002B4B92BE|nr:S8 family serine peptidase [Flavobacterium sp.]HLP64122.1 S8 family serine peptidase [Flavobacterium sp.]